MRATLIHGPGDIRSEIVRDPIRQRPTDALVRVVASVRADLPELLEDDVLAGRIEPGLVFDSTMPLADVAQDYRAMDERTAIKVLLK